MKNGNILGFQLKREQITRKTEEENNSVMAKDIFFEKYNLEKRKNIKMVRIPMIATKKAIPEGVLPKINALM